MLSDPFRAGAREATEAFLRTQGDPGDTQADMLMALVAVLVVSRGHDRSLAKVLAKR